MGDVVKRICEAGVAALAMVAIAGLWGEAHAQQEGCSTTWTTACASVEAFTFTDEDGKNYLVLSVVNSSATEGGGTLDNENSLIHWMQANVNPDGANLMGTTVWTGDCDPTTSFAEQGDACEDISDYWTASTNNQGGIDWELGEMAEEGGGIATETSGCDGLRNPCWVGPAYFVLEYDESVELEAWTAQLIRLGEDQEGSDWVQVPEPITTTLLGVGLAGWAGATARRRRREDGLDVVEEEGV